MNTNKHFSAKTETPNSKLQKSSVIFMQLGLILSLFAVYLALEYKTIYKVYAYVEPETKVNPDIYVPGEINIIDKQKNTPTKVTKVKPVTKPKPVLDKLNVIENNKKITNEMPKDLLDTEDDQNTKQAITVDEITSVELPNKPKDEDLTFVKVEVKPTFYKCKNKKGESQKTCFNKQMSKYVNKYFDVELAQNLGLEQGKHRIYVQFVIDKNGDIINVHSNATHPRLKKEAERVVKKLPKMIPGRQRLHNVNVKYNLPINFMVE